MSNFATMEERTRLDAIRYARGRTTNEGRVYIVREDHGKYFVVPLYEKGQEGYKVDVGYAELGILVAESLLQ